jgi:hypothetical protein
MAEFYPDDQSRPVMVQKITIGNQNRYFKLNTAPNVWRVL